MSNNPHTAQASLSDDSGATFLIRWRGRQEGPYTAAVIEAKLAAREIGLLHEISHNGRWITIRDCLAEQDAARRVEQQAREDGERRAREAGERLRQERAEEQKHLELRLQVESNQQKASAESSRGGLEHGGPTERGGSLAHSGERPGFWLRVAAHVIDTIMCCAASIAAGFAVVFIAGAAGLMDRQLWYSDPLAKVVAVAQLAGGWLYYAVMESCPKQATLGKIACGFIVTDMQGRRISFAQATGRTFCMVFSALILFIGYLMCAWTDRKQCLHDMMAGCQMFKR